MSFLAAVWDRSAVPTASGGGSRGAMGYDRDRCHQAVLIVPQPISHKSSNIFTRRLPHLLFVFAPLPDVLEDLASRGLSDSGTGHLWAGDDAYAANNIER